MTDQIRTEYAVVYTEFPGSKQSITQVREDVTDRARAEALLHRIRLWQAGSEFNLPLDAKPVSRTVTVTEWQPFEPAGFGTDGRARITWTPNEPDDQIVYLGKVDDVVVFLIGRHHCHGNKEWTVFGTATRDSIGDFDDLAEAQAYAEMLLAARAEEGLRAQGDEWQCLSR